MLKLKQASGEPDSSEHELHELHEHHVFLELELTELSARAVCSCDLLQNIHGEKRKRNGLLCCCFIEEKNIPYVVLWSATYEQSNLFSHFFVVFYVGVW